MTGGRQIAERPRRAALRAAATVAVLACAVFAGAAFSAPDRHAQAQAERKAELAVHAAAVRARRLDAVEQQVRELADRLTATAASARHWQVRAERAERRLDRTRDRVERRRR